MLIHWLWLIVILTIAGCGSSSRLSHENLTGQFDFSKVSLNPSIIIFHSDTDSSKLFYKLDPGSLLFMNKSQEFYATLSIHYQLYSSFTSTILLDSGSFSNDFFSQDPDFLVMGNLKFKMGMGTEGVLKIVVRDVNRKVETSKIIFVKKLNTRQRQFYFVADTSGNPLYRNFISLNEPFDIHSDLNTDHKFIVRCYFRDFPLAPPPFHTGPEMFFNYNADSIFVVESEQVRSLRLKRNGIYHFQNDSSTKEGFTIFIFNDDFPYIRNVEQLIDPTRYLTSKKEYQNLVIAKNKKAAVDRFWLELGGNQDRSRLLIKLYYQRIQDANMLFTSYTEGWKTDRGMIYIIFGQPISVYSDGINEDWSYSALNGASEFRFSFRKVPNPFSDNDYSLIRMPVYENDWYITVDDWRQGKIVNE